MRTMWIIMFVARQAIRAASFRHGYFVCSLLITVLGRVSSDQSLLPVQLDRIQDLHACAGTRAYIPWPLNIKERHGHKGTTITLRFRARLAPESVEIASYNSDGLKPYRKRLKLSAEHSGVFLNYLTMADDGVFTAQARSAKGRVWTRSTNLTVHVAPTIQEGQFTVGKTEPLSPEGGPAKLHCIKLTCGPIDYAGYPPTQYVWQSRSKVLAVETAHHESLSMLELCGPFTDHVTCSVGGFSSTCTYDHVSSIYVDLPGPATNTSTVATAGVSSDLVLMIVAPVLAVGIPLIILAVWVLSHVLADRRRRAWNRNQKTKNGDQLTCNGSITLQLRKRNQHNHVEDVDLEDNILTEQTHNTGEASDDMAEDDNDDEEEEVVMSRGRGNVNGIAGDQGRNAVRIVEVDRIHFAAGQYPGSRANCNSIPGRGLGGRVGESPDSVAKSAFSTIDSRSTADGNTLDLEGYHRGNHDPSLDNTLVKTRVNFDIDRRDHGEIGRASDVDDDDDDDDEELHQPLVEATLV